MTAISTPNILNVSELLKYTTGDNINCLQLDLVALLFDAFIYVEQNKGPDINKYSYVRDCIFELNKELFSKVYNERFSAGCALQWHNPINQTITQSKKMIYDYFLPELKTTHILDIENLIHLIDLNSHEKSFYVARVQTCVYNFAIDMAPKIIIAWDKLNSSIIGDS